MMYFGCWDTSASLSHSLSLSLSLSLTHTHFLGCGGQGGGPPRPSLFLRDREYTHLFLPTRQVAAIEARVDQGDDVAGVGALPDEGEEDEGEGPGDQVLEGGGEVAAPGCAGGLEVERGVGW
jgi:hypothetical protein